MVSLFHLFVEVAQAAPNIAPIEGVTAHAPGETINNLYTAILNIASVLAAAIAGLTIVWGGFQYITSAGDPAKAKLARGVVINAMIGIVIIFTTYGIMRLAIAIGTQLVSNTTSSGGGGGGGGGGGTSPSPGGGGTSPSPGGGGTGGGPVTVALAATNGQTVSGKTQVIIYPTSGTATTTPRGSYGSGDKFEKNIESDGPFTVSTTGPGSDYKDCTATTNTYATSRPILKITLIPKALGGTCSAKFETTPDTGGISTQFLAFDADTGARLDNFPIHLTLNGFQKANHYGDTFTLDSTGPFQASVTFDTPQPYTACTNIPTNAYTGSTVLKFRLKPLGGVNPCKATFDIPNPINIGVTVVVTDSANNQPITNASFILWDSNLLGSDKSNLGTVTNGRRTFTFAARYRRLSLQASGYQTCEQLYNFQGEGLFTLHMTKTGETVPSAGQVGGESGHPSCHYTLAPDLPNLP